MQGDAPLLLVGYNRAQKQFQVQEDAAAVLRTLRTPLAVVAAVGRSRIGKSYLLNRLAGCEPGQGFKVAATARAVTEGIWLWPTPIAAAHDRAVVLLDTEGMDDCSQEEGYDNKLFTLAMLLSSCLM